VNNNKAINIIFFITILGSLNFYTPKFITISPQIYKLIYYLCCGLLFYFAWQPKKQRIRYNRNYNKYFWILGFGFIGSIYMSYCYEKQDIGIGLMTTLPYFTYLLYLVFQKGEISNLVIEKYIKTLAIIFMVLFIINRIVYPLTLFGESEMDLNRGGIRMHLVGFSWVSLFFFYSIQKFSKTGEKSHLFWIIICFIFTVLSLTRQVIAISAVLGVWFLLQKLSLAKKCIVFGFILCLFGYLIPQIPIIQKLVNQTKEQSANNQTGEDDIRLKAWHFYTAEYQKNSLQHAFGCGVPSFGNSSYGIKIDKLTQLNHCYLVDVGWAGFYFLFGAITTLVLIVLILITIFRKSNSSMLYCRYYVCSVGLLAIASAPIIFTGEIFTFIVAVYLISIKTKRKSIRNGRNYNHQL